MEDATGDRAKKRPDTGQTGSGGGAGEPNGRWKLRAVQRSIRSGTLTLEWRFREGAAVSGERKAGTSWRPHRREKVEGCGVPQSFDPGTGENGSRGAERRSAQRSSMRCSMPCMPVVGKAGNRVTWNHFFLRRGGRGKSGRPAFIFWLHGPALRVVYRPAADNSLCSAMYSRTKALNALASATRVWSPRPTG